MSLAVSFCMQPEAQNFSTDFHKTAAGSAGFLGLVYGMDRRADFLDEVFCLSAKRRPVRTSDEEIGACIHGFKWLLSLVMSPDQSFPVSFMLFLFYYLLLIVSTGDNCVSRAFAVLLFLRAAAGHSSSLLLR